MFIKKWNEEFPLLCCSLRPWTSTWPGGCSSCLPLKKHLESGKCSAFLGQDSHTWDQVPFTSDLCLALFFCWPAHQWCCLLPAAVQDSDTLVLALWWDCTEGGCRECYSLVSVWLFCLMGQKYRLQCFLFAWTFALFLVVTDHWEPDLIMWWCCCFLQSQVMP